MPTTSAHSATRRRCEQQLEHLAALPAETPLSAVRPIGEDQSRFTLHLGRVRLGPIHAKDLPDLPLGTPLDAPTRAHLAAALEREAARTDALALLRTRARSSRDLLSRLARKGHDQAAAGEALERLARVGLIDDGAFAADRAGVLADSGTIGPRAAEAKLRALGIEGQIASAAIREAFAETDLLAQATEAACRRARTMPQSLDDQTRRRRLASFLARRGYDHDICREAVKVALAGETD